MANKFTLPEDFEFNFNDITDTWVYMDYPLAGVFKVDKYEVVFNAAFENKHGEPLMLFSYIPKSLLKDIHKGKTPFRAAFTDIRSILYREIETSTSSVKVIPLSRDDLTDSCLPLKDSYFHKR